ncbi:MAG: prepilin-type N-terminal cleavage/methylation domain-containing protein [Deltaproteobacteria bacterium]|nr:prepilin-type N-terminal cleavage/methylation domain-containing protein [Deltaproteobacteria bacterium]
MKRSEQEGYTLIELVITLSIVALTLLFSAPSIADWAPYYRMKGDATTIAGMLTNARFEAVKRGQNVTVTFDPSAETVTVSAGGTTLNTYTLSQSVDFGINQVIEKDDLNASGHPPTKKITFAGSSVVFASNGAATPAGELYLMFDPAATVNKQYFFGVAVEASGQVTYSRWNESGAAWD